jgi:chromosome segregation ATPase
MTVLPDNGNLKASSSSSGSSASSGSSDAGEARNEKYWRRQAADRREAVEEADKSVRNLQARITALRNDLTPTNLMDPSRLQTQDRDIRQAEEDLEAARREAATARQRLADLEDEARRAGALPGWVR